MLAFFSAAGSTRADDASTLRVYDIAAHPLDTALDIYIKASGTQVFYETALTAGLTAKPVNGRFTPGAALDELLTGTGLIARRTDSDAFIVLAAPRQQSALAGLATASGLLFMTALQRGVVDALCRSERTRPGAYKVALEIWIAPSGVFQRTSLVGSTGDVERDRAVVAALSGVSIRMAPPSDSLQPFILSIGARPPDQTGDCSG